MKHSNQNIKVHIHTSLDRETGEFIASANTDKFGGAVAFGITKEAAINKVKTLIESTLITASLLQLRSNEPFTQLGVPNQIMNFKAKYVFKSA